MFFVVSGRVIGEKLKLRCRAFNDEFEFLFDIYFDKNDAANYLEGKEVKLDIQIDNVTKNLKRIEFFDEEEIKRNIIEILKKEKGQEEYLKGFLSIEKFGELKIKKESNGQNIIENNFGEFKVAYDVDLEKKKLSPKSVMFERNKSTEFMFIENYNFKKNEDFFNDEKIKLKILFL